MATTTAPRRASDKSLPTLATELWQLVLGYLKQETVEPLKGMLHFLAWGVAGSLLLSVGLSLWLLGLLRALQTETGSHLAGNLSFLPYVLTMIAAVVVAGLAARAIGSQKRKAARKSTTA